MLNVHRVRRYSWLAALCVTLLGVATWRVWTRHLGHQLTVPVALQQEFRRAGQAVIQPYQFPVALSSDGTRLLVKEKTETAFAFRIYQNNTLLAKLSLDKPQWEIAWNPAGTAVSFLSEIGDIPGVYAPYVWWIDQDHATVMKGFASNRASYAFKWSPDGRYISYIASSHEDSKLVILPAKDNSISEMDVDGVYPDAGMAWSPDSKTVISARQDDQGLVIQKFDMHDATTTDVAQLPVGKLKGLSWAPSLQTIATTFRGEKDNYFRLTTLAAEGQFHLCADEDGDVISPIAVNAGDMLEFIVEKDSHQSIYMSHACRTPIEIHQVPSGIGRLQDDGYNHNPVPFIESRPDGPTQVVLPSRVPSGRHRVTEASASSLWAKHLWLDGSSYRVGAWLWEPEPNVTSDKAIVMVHGGPRLHETNEWEPLREAFREHGYLVLTPNYGGSSGYGRRYEEILDLDAQADDLITAVRYLTTMRHIKPGNVTIFASSYGTRVLLRALENQPNLVPVIIFAPFLAAPFEAENPISFRGTVLAFHGRRDPISDPQFAIEALQRVFPDALSRRKLYWRQFEDEAHGSNRISSLQEEYGEIICVLEAHSCESMR